VAADRPALHPYHVSLVERLAEGRGRRSPERSRLLPVAAEVGFVRMRAGCLGCRLAKRSRSRLPSGSAQLRDDQVRGRVVERARNRYGLAARGGSTGTVDRLGSPSEAPSRRSIRDRSVGRLLTRTFGSSTDPLAFSCVLQNFLKWRDPESNRRHHDFQSRSVRSSPYWCVRFFGLFRRYSIVLWRSLVRCVPVRISPVAVRVAVRLKRLDVAHIEIYVPRVFAELYALLAGWNIILWMV
jgi:hypothetical protein